MEADFAASELARMFASTPDVCFDVVGRPTSPSASASYEPSSSPWPKADGTITLLDGSAANTKSIALEYKRPHEGVHGLLTAMGQAYSYLHKGYHGAAIVIPKVYATHGSPGEFLRSALDYIDGSGAIGVFHYDVPDISSSTPFAGKLHCVRPMKLATLLSTPHIAAVPKTQWVHMREGSTTRDGFFRFLQVAKVLAADGTTVVPDVPHELIAAVGRIDPNRDAYSYLANTADERFLSRAWRQFWFQWIATRDVLTPWVRDDDGVYSPPGAFTRILRDDARGFSQIFEGRANGLKETICGLLNSGKINEATGWEMLAAGVESAFRTTKQGVRARAHSYREDLDSALAQLEWIDAEGHPTDHGYRFAAICERFNGANSPAAREYFGATLIQTGRYGSFLHYVYRLSEEKFQGDPLGFTRETPNGAPVFNEDSYSEYLQFIEDKMANDLRVIRKVSGRERPRQRTQFQAELTLLRNYGFISASRHRLGVGIPIDWDRVMDARNVKL
jgi:hypothetical protein